MKRIVVALVILAFSHAAVVGPTLVAGHDHHDHTAHQAMHSTLACVWTCAASAFVDSPRDHSVGMLGLVDHAEFQITTSHPEFLFYSFSSRAPPVLA